MNFNHGSSTFDHGAQFQFIFVVYIISDISRELELGDNCVMIYLHYAFYGLLAHCFLLGCGRRLGDSMGFNSGDALCAEKVYNEKIFILER